MCHDFLLTMCNVQENYLNKHEKCTHVQVVHSSVSPSVWSGKRCLPNINVTCHEVLSSAHILHGQIHVTISCTHKLEVNALHLLLSLMNELVVIRSRTQLQKFVGD
jgi:hypothetical protein